MMKFKYLVGLLAMLFITFVALKSSEAEGEKPNPHDVYVFPLDTITDIETATFVYPWTIQTSSNGGHYSISWQFELNQISGTTNAAAYTDQSNASEGTDWAQMTDL